MGVIAKKEIPSQAEIGIFLACRMHESTYILSGFNPFITHTEETFCLKTSYTLLVNF